MGVFFNSYIIIYTLYMMLWTITEFLVFILFFSCWNKRNFRSDLSRIKKVSIFYYTWYSLTHFIFGFLHSPVSTMNGKMDVNLIWLFRASSRSSSASASIRPRTANLDAQYGTRLGSPTTPAMEEMPTTWPLFFSIMSGRKVSSTWKS